MSNKLSELLQTNTLNRRVEDYEETFDDFIASAGGQRVKDVAIIPPKVRNADYVLDATDARLIVELKQVNKYMKSQSVDEYFRNLLRRGKVRQPKFTSSGHLRIEPSSLSVSDWNHFYRKFRPQIPDCLDKAARQIKATPSFLPSTDQRQIGLAVLINTGDYNLPVDLMFRIVERHANLKWKAGRFSALDCILCFSMDMVKPGQHPFHSRAIVRNKDDQLISNSAMHLFNKWIQYRADAVGAEAIFTPSEVEPEPLQFSGGNTGKIRWVP